MGVVIFFVVGKAISSAGSLIIIFFIIGSVVIYSIMRALGEIAVKSLFVEYYLNRCKQEESYATFRFFVDKKWKKTKSNFIRFWSFVYRTSRRI
jgi:amino acid permease